MSKQEGPAARRDYGTGATAAPVVHVTRTSPERSWVFGTTVIPVPAGSAAPPWTALFLAHADGGRWDITLSGTAGFGHMLAVAEVLTAAEKQLLARFSAVQAASAASARAGGYRWAGQQRAGAAAGRSTPWHPRLARPEAALRRQLGPRPLAMPRRLWAVSRRPRAVSRRPRRRVRWRLSTPLLVVRRLVPRASSPPWRSGEGRGGSSRRSAAWGRQRRCSRSQVATGGCAPRARGGSTDSAADLGTTR